MSENESFRSTSAGGDAFSEADLRLVLESIGEVASLPGAGLAASVGMASASREHSARQISRIFAVDVAPGAAASVFTTEGRSDIDLLLVFDLDDVVADLRRDIAAGISKNRRLIDFLGGLPVDVTDRIDAAKANPRKAAHFVGTAADHLARALRIRIQDMLLPVADHGRQLSWRGRIPLVGARDVAAASLIPFATSVMIEVPASFLEIENV